MKVVNRKINGKGNNDEGHEVGHKMLAINST